MRVLILIVTGLVILFASLVIGEAQESYACPLCATYNPSFAPHCQRCGRVLGA